ncbi:MAG TPA: NAD-dependent epimerase/dehydratase family protein [Polyangia bacterium]|nr:NAD-dependent epimerase/dehydratase family protein [Polyangia bacterium]
MRSLVVGGAGFIGSHLVDQLVLRGPVTIYDNLSIGCREFVAQHIEAGRVRLVQADCLDLAALCAAMPGHDAVFHLSANPEARWGLDNTRFDLEQGTIATYNVLEAMRRTEVQRIVFSSSGTVYGDVATPVPEDFGPSLPISLYGASKLASEGLLSAFSHCFGLKVWIFRFGNVMGPRGTHGAALDFVKKLERDPTRLEVLGDGEQRKPYLHVSDCVAGILFGFDHADDALNYFNLGPPDATAVKDIAHIVIEEMGLAGARIEFTGGQRGWPGDVPRSFLQPDKLAALGFRVRYSSDQAVRLAVRDLVREWKARGFK